MSQDRRKLHATCFRNCSLVSEDFAKPQPPPPLHVHNSNGLETTAMTVSALLLGTTSETWLPFSQAEEEEHGSLSDKAQPALKRLHRKQPKRFQKKRASSAAALKAAGGAKGIADDNKGIASDDKGIAGDNGIAGSDKGIADDDKGWDGDDKGIAGSDKGIADETAAASKRSGALAQKRASAAGDVSWHLSRLRTPQATWILHLVWFCTFSLLDKHGLHGNNTLLASVCCTPKKV